MAIYNRDNHGSFDGEVTAEDFHSDECDDRCDIQPCICTPVTLAYLHHQCGQWCIGEREDVERMIAALQVIVETMPKTGGAR